MFRYLIILNYILVWQAAHALDHSASLTVDLKDAAKGRISGLVRFTSQRDATCWYLPLNDPDHHIDIARGLSPSIMKYGRQQRGGDFLQVRAKELAGHLVTPYLLRLEPGQHEISFQASLPRWFVSEGEGRWFFNDYHPILLKSCPEPGLESLHFQPEQKMAWQIKVSQKGDWQWAHAGLEVQDAVRFRGSKFSFSYAKENHRESFEVRGTAVEVVYYSEGFKEVLGYIRPFLEQSIEMLGPYPFSKLLVVETEELEKSLVPGVITINREKQREVKSRAKSPFHWHIWQLANFIPQQWIGLGLYPQTLDEFWFHKGLVDTLAYLLLKNQPRIANFFNREKGGFFDFTFDYRQAQDLISGVLTFLHPFSALTTATGATVDPLEEQHAFGYIRHSLALRYLYWRLGQSRFYELIRDFCRRNIFKPVTGQDFLAYLEKHKDADARASRSHLIQWWSQDSWPDFYLLDVESKGVPAANQKQVVVKVGQAENFDLPIDVVLTNQMGQTYEAEATGKAGKDYMEALFTIEGEVDRVEINPERETFDWDRFNNSNGLPQFRLFPGNADTLEDDATTIIWLPLFAKLPGEEFSLIFSSVFLRYLKSVYTTLFSYVPSENRLGFKGYFLTDLPKFGLFTVMQVAQDFGNGLRGERLVEAGLYRAPFIWKEPNTEVGIRLRSRQVLGWEDSLHQTITARLRVVPLNPGTCHYQIKADFESTPGVTPGGFSYSRNMGLIRTNCRVFSLDLGFSGFWGQVSGSGSIPENVLFKPQNVDEARVRIDTPTLASVEQIRNMGLDLLWPARLPLPSTLFLLPKESRWRLFYDHAVTEGPEETFKDAGAGLLVPVGGDAVGKRSISILQFSLLVVLYRQYDGKSDTTPGVLVDFLGKL